MQVSGVRRNTGDYLTLFALFFCAALAGTILGKGRASLPSDRTAILRVLDVFGFCQESRLPSECSHLTAVFATSFAVSGLILTLTTALSFGLILVRAVHACERRVCSARTHRLFFGQLLDPNLSQSKRLGHTFWAQSRAVAFNLFVVLPSYQTLWDALMIYGYTKVYSSPVDGICMALASALGWIFIFELCWYTQHRGTAL